MNKTSNAVSEQSRKLKELKNELNQIKQGGSGVSIVNQSMDSSKVNLSTTANETIKHVKKSIRVVVQDDSSDEESAAASACERILKLFESAISEQATEEPAGGRSQKM